MSKEQLHEMTLHLDDIQDIFADPEPGSDRYVSGIDYLYSEIKTHSPREKFKVTIVLPQEKITEALVEKTREKVKRYCRFKIEENQKELIAQRHERSYALWVGLTVLVVGLVLAGILTLIARSIEPSGINLLLAVLLAIAGQGFVVAGWVAMWQPVELILYDWWPFRRDIRIYKQIADADIVIREGELRESMSTSEDRELLNK